MSDLAMPMLPEIRRTSQALTGTRLVWWLLGTLFAMVIVTTMAPGHRPSVLAWIGLVLIVLLGAFGVAALSTARTPGLLLTERRGQLIFALAVTLIALLVSAFFGLGATIWCSLGLTVAYVGVLSDPFDGKRWLFVIALAALIPLWTWSAVGAWDTRLLILLLVAVLAHNAMIHLGATTARAGSPLVDDISRGKDAGPRPHVLGGLLSLLLATALVLIVGLASTASAGPLVFAAIVALISVGLSYMVERSQGDRAAGAFGAVQLSAFAILALSFLASL